MQSFDCFIAIGYKPNTNICKGWLPKDDVGYIQTVPGSTKTNIPGVFTSGDAQDKIYRSQLPGSAPAVGHT